MRKRDLGPNFALALPTAAKSGEIEPGKGLKLSKCDENNHE